MLTTCQICIMIKLGYTQRKLRHRTSLFCPFGGFYCMTKFKIQAEIAQFNNLKLINSFCNLINDDTETLEQTAERFVGSPEYRSDQQFKNRVDKTIKTKHSNCDKQLSQVKVKLKAYYINSSFGGCFCLIDNQIKLSIIQLGATDVRNPIQT
jgi:hypothetical protein